MKTTEESARLVARRDIVSAVHTFHRGQRLLGARYGHGSWKVWARRDPSAFVVGVIDEYVRVVDTPATRRMEAARHFPSNTCPASRHAAMLADELVRSGRCQQIADEPQHCGESIAAVVAALWEARTELAELRDRVAEASVARRRLDVSDAMTPCTS